MKLKNVLIVVKDIERARQFYHDLFGLEMILDNDGNMILTEGLVLQDEKIWRQFLDKDIIPQNNACELYFEEADIEGFVEKLEKYYPECHAIYTDSSYRDGRETGRKNNYSCRNRETVLSGKRRIEAEGRVCQERVCLYSS